MNKFQTFLERLRNLNIHYIRPIDGYDGDSFYIAKEVQELIEEFHIV
jgi:hypothetical protein